MAAKKTKTKSLLPKRIAGVKVPKAARRGRFGELLASRTGQALIAEAMTAQEGACGASELPADVSERLRMAGEIAGREAGAAGATLAFALGEAARSFMAAMAQPETSQRPAADNDAFANSDKPQAKPSKKKPASPEAEPL